MKRAPVYCWIEPIDRQCAAVHARCRARKGIWVYGLSIMVLMELPITLRHAAFEIARDRLRTIVRDEYYGHLPKIGRVDKMPVGDVA